jgi:hypothetical protein
MSTGDDITVLRPPDAAMSDVTINPRDFGALEADVKSLKDDIAELRRDVLVLTSLLHQARGGWRVAAWAIGAAFASGGLAAWIKREFFG